jgi:endonuclease/exonuclease/phosphatase (EEP) superfamily protein YafD
MSLMTDNAVLDTLPDQPLPSRKVRRSRLSALTNLLCWSYAVVILALFILMRVFAEKWWIATILLFAPRWVWMLPLAVIIPMTALFRRRMAIPSMVGALIVLFGIMDFRVPWQLALPHGRTSQNLTVFTCNLHNTQSSLALLNALIADANPDLILLQDYSNQREPLVARQPGWTSRSANGMYVLSRYPIQGEIEQVLSLDEIAQAYRQHKVPLGKAQSCVIELPDGPIHVINLHLASPHIPLDRIKAHPLNGGAPLSANSSQRARESVIVTSRAREIGGSMIIAGDFNTPDDSPIFRQAWESWNDAFSTAGLGFGATYAKHHTWLRIDHVLSDPSWHCTACWVGPDIGSGHHPIVATLQR